MDTTLDAPRAPRLVTECAATMSTRKPRLKANLVVRSRIALRLSQKELGALMGVSMRTAHRWEAGTSEPDGTQLQRLALSVLPSDGNLATELAEAGGTTLETLLPPVAPVAPPEPVRAAAAPAIAPPLSANVRETDARSKFSVEGEQAKAARDDIIEPSPRSPPLPDGSDVQGHEAALHRRVQEEGPAGGRRLYGVRSDRRVAPARGPVLVSPGDLAACSWKRGELEGLAPRKRGQSGRRRSPTRSPGSWQPRSARSRTGAENAKLQIICEVQKKSHCSWG